MKKILLVLSIVIVTFCGTAFLLLFQGNINNASEWWSSYTRDKEWMPYSPYSNRVENADYLLIKDATQIKVIDRNIFWKGSGAIIIPEINNEGIVVNLIVKKGGKGYSKKVEILATGSGSEKFKFGDVNVQDGQIKDVKILKTAKWYFLPTAFWGEENFPYTGVVENKFPNGQNLTEEHYLNGLLHGSSKRFTERGVPVYKKDFKNGLKNGTHIYYFDIPLNPDSNLGQKQTLWEKINEEYEGKQKTYNNRNRINAEMIEAFRLKGGAFQVKLLEHWKDNRKDGLFEAYDRFGNKRYKDEYKKGLRTSHRIFDKDKTKSFDRKKED